MRIDSHHSFSARYPLEHLESILKRNRFEGSILIGELAPVPAFVQGIVVPASPNDLHAIEGFQHNPLFRGILSSIGEELPEGLAELERRGIPLDAVASPSTVLRIAERFPALRIAMVHLGSPPAEGPSLDAWARDLALAAQAPQVVAKLSGIAALPSPRACVQHALAAFGPGRLMFGSDWPAGLPDTTWKASLAAFTQAIGAQPIEVREELLGGTAARFYALGPPRYTETSV